MSESERTRYGLNAAPQRAIAVIGLACRLPGAPDADALWRLLRSGDSAVRPTPADRLRLAGAPAEGTPGDDAPRWGGYLDDVTGFDAGFFGISPREADTMDPQQRLVLELAWEALEDARVVPARLGATSTGVFIGAAHDDYATLAHALDPDSVTHQAFTGTHRALIANRISYLLGLRGPSITLDSAQSSSLVALHLACESLRSGDSEIALAGGVNLQLALQSSLFPHRFGALSPDGRCYTFDARANGYVRGEGGGLVVLKPLDRALADGDPIRAVIRGSAVNNDGGGATLTAPDAAAQEDVVRRALHNAGAAPGDIQYVELHGTGTPVGDPVEAAALGAVLSTGRPAGTPPLHVGSVKTNIGHLEGAAGIAGLLKTILALQHRELPPTLNHETPNPDIPLDTLRLRVQTELGPWPRPDTSLMAGVSSFGMGGTNAHVVLEEAPGVADPGEREEPAPVFAAGGVVPWVVSGRGREGLAGQAGRLAAFAESADESLRPVDVAWSLAATRTAFENRAVVLGAGTSEAGSLLGELASGAVSAAGVVRGAVAAGVERVAFVFPGQGAQWAGMGRELWDASPVFAESMEACERALAPYVGWSLSEVVRGGGELADVDVVQPVSWAVMVSLAAVWRACGVQPSVVVGHSQGEIAAAVVAGGLSLEDGARVVALRSRAIRAIAGRGGMVSVPLPLEQTEELLTGWQGRIGTAAVNGPSSVVVAGDADALDELMAHCEGADVRARRVPVDYASHTWHVEAIEDELARVLAPVAPRTGEVPFFSTTEAELIDTARLDGGYWYRNLRQRVRFADAVQGLVEQGYSAFVEVSSHPVLGMAVQDAAPDAVVVGTLRRSEGGIERFLTSLAEAWVRGIPVDWTRVLAGQGGRTVALPTYAFQRRHYWLDGEASRRTVSFAQPAASEQVGSRAAVTGQGDLLQRIRAHAAVVLGHTGAGEVDASLTFKALGFDSATSVELRNRLVADTGVSLPASVLFDHPTPQALARHVHQLLEGGAEPAPEAVEKPRTATDEEPIAVVAMGCRLPGGIRTPEELWELLAAGGDTVSAFPADRGWDLENLYHPDPEHHGTTYARSGSFLYDAAEFDPFFFGISPREAEAMDPQQRLLLEASWEALERAGIDPATLRESDGGVFLGLMQQEYGPGLQHAPESVDGYLLTGTSCSVASGRIAYVLGLRGQAVTVDTACSSSLVALHMAVQALRSRECSFALAGGATVMAEPGIFVEFSRQRGLAPDGRCKPFAAGADGTGWGEGVGVLLLERLSDARRNGHPVLAVIRGSAVNQDGASNGLTAPNGPSQERVIRAALANARLTPDLVDAVEAHGTGTTLGDPIEAQAVLDTYGRNRDPERPLWLGSLKSNIGHTQAAAGVAGVMKMVLAMQHGVLPRTLNVDEPTPHVDWSAGAVSLLTEPVEWPRVEGRPRRAGVSSFGISGTNAHVVLEEAPRAPEPGERGEQPDPVFASGGVLPWVVSGRGADGLAGQAGRLASFAGSVEGSVRPVDVAWSLAATRTAFENRAVILGREASELRSMTQELAARAEVVPSSVIRGRATQSVNGVAFVFPGQGAQWAGMGRELWDASPVFAESMEACERALAPYVGWSLSEVVRGGGELADVDVVQPVSWAVMVSLAAVWRACGVQPSVVVGHSQGEIAAAVVAGGLSLEDGARVVALRSRAIRAIAGRGGMVSVPLPLEQTEELLTGWQGRIGIAAVNGPSSVVVAGDADALDELMAHCEGADVRARRVPVDYASHTWHVEAIEDELARVLAPVAPRTGEVPFFSTTEAELIDTARLDGGYWYRNLRQRVRFADAVQGLVEQGYSAFVEVSSHPVLGMAVQEAASDAVVVGSLRRNEGGTSRFLTSLAEAWVRGVPVDWTRVLAGQGGRTVALPTYAFQHRRYWLEKTAPATAVVASDTVDARFWEAVEREDLESLAGTLQLADSEPLAEVLPALSRWRKDEAARSAVDGWRYKVVWKPVGRESRPVALDGAWLLVVPEGEAAGVEFVGAVADALTRRGARVRTLTLASRHAEAAVLGSALGEALAGLDAPLAGVLALTGLDESPLPEHPVLSTGAALTVSLLQALGRAGVSAPLWCATQGAVAVRDQETVAHPEQAAVWGLGRVAALEFPERWGGLVDLPERLDGRDAAALCAVLAARGDAPEDQVALRGGTTFVRRLMPAPLSEHSAADGSGARVAPRRWTPTGTALVTGGTGALGAHVTRWLARSGAADVVLVGRRGATDTAALAELEAEVAPYGTRLTVAACDVADRAALVELLSSLRAQGRTVRTVVHAAGVGVLGALDDLGIAEFAEVTAGKVAGARNLTEVLDPAETDALICFSSISGIWGVADHAAYAAANATLDALAENARRTRGLPALSVAWGPWDGGGMISEEMRDPLRRRGIPVIAPEPAMVALQQALDHDDTVVAVADVDWNRFVSVFTVARSAPLIAHLKPKAPADTTRTGRGESAEATGEGPGASTLAERLRALPAADRDHFVQDIVCAEAAAVLGHSSADAIDAAYAFKELGFDSVSAVELRNRLTARTGLKITTTVVFDHPTPLALAQHLRHLALGGDEAPRDAAALEPARSVPRDAATDDDPIAVVAMACRYPGGIGTPDDLWRVVTAGEDVITGFPADRGWDTHRLYDPDPAHPGTSYVRHGGFLHDAGHFDAAFFGVSPREAEAMDPQQRLLLETSWEALERAGIDPRTLRGSRTGVFTGLTDQNYGTRLSRSTDGTEGYLVTGASTAVASGRVSYVLGLEGPAVTVDTACSSSLVALHLAVGSLRSGECSMALAGAAMVMADPAPFVGFSRQRGLAPDGRCKPFAEAADGFALAEGVGVVLLERLSDARRNGHPVLAVVRGTAINQDGASNGLTAPNGPSQQRVIRAALADARLTAAEVDVVEAHGTGTRLGDPIEAQALLATYGQERPQDRPLLIGSVKSNIGHTQTASGMAGVMKMVLAMRHGIVPGTLHVDAPSSHVDWSAGAVSLVTDPVDWPDTDGRPRRAGVSSFGISGTNAHVVLEEAPDVPQPEEHEEQPDPVFAAGGVVPWAVSGRGQEGLAGQAGRLAAFAAEAAEESVRPVDVAWSLAATRTAFENRAVVLGSGTSELSAQLGELASDAVSATDALRGAVTPGADRVVFVFPGQGAQWAGMGRELWDASPVFAASMEACERALAPYVDWSLSEVVRGGGELADVDVVQPVSWAVMVSLAAVWRACGVQPSVVVGHSQGEIAAAVVAGGLSLEDGARVVALRSRAIRAIAGRGGMVSVQLPLRQVEDLVAQWTGRIDIAAVNGPSSVVVAGDADALDELMAHCEGADVRARRVPVDYASHTWHVEAIEDELARALAPVAPQSSDVPFFSTVEAEPVDTARLDGGYWYRNLRQRVRFADAVQGLVEQGYSAFVEVSSHPVLGMAVQEAAPDGVVVGTLRRNKGGAPRFLTSLAEAWVRGVPVDWKRVLAGQGGRTIALPTYAFQHRRYWLDVPEPALPSGVADTARDDVDARFWDAVEREDLEALADTLDLAPERRETLGAAEPVLPVLAEWRRRRRESALLNSWRYTVTWQPADADATEPGALPSHWLVVLPGGGPDAGTVGGDDDSLTRELIERLRDREDVEAVETVFFDVDRDDRAALAARLRETLERGPAVGAVLNLMPLDPADTPWDDEASEPGVPRPVTATLLLMQALTDTSAQLPLWTVTRGAVTVTGPVPPGGTSDGGPVPDQAAVWGLGRVYGLEHPHHWGGLLDLPAAPGSAAAELDARTWDRFFAGLAGDDDEDQFAVRADGLYVRRLIRKPADPDSGTGTDAAGRRTVGFSGTTLLTGGTGALGAHLARRLAATGAEHLLLVSRRGPDAPGAAELEAELTALGAGVTIAACDITDRDALAKLLADVPESAPVNAVVHAAGLEPPAVSVEDTDLEALRAVAEAKIAGAVHLDALLADRPLEAFVLFSSGAGVWGDGGHSGYAAANAYLDAFAEWRRARGRVATSIAWGAWAGGGMVDDAESDRLRRYGVPTMDPEVAVGAVQQALGRDETFLVVADVLWDRFAATYSAARRRRLFDEIPEVRGAAAAAARATAARDGADGSMDGGVTGAFAGRLAGVSRAEQERRVLQLVRTQVAAVLGHDGTAAISPSHAFRDLGFDSLTAVELRNRLKDATGLALPATLVFDHPTPAALAGRLLAELAPGTEQSGGQELSALDELEAAVATLDPADDAARGRITARLQALLWRLSDSPAESTAASAGAGTDDDALLDAVSDDEMFDLIDKELGLN
ncbi:type I polyketide synthase [Streptomyces sp. NBC_00557]|uniref:type I polyketide synthase n=2 Tax=Streptomyces TaxID=1883 RepID=UPI002E813F1B|nr:SDR family NAD(P)-dependent oxidoreductase [Streptomyces sp. NBC_00557]WUC33044.1 SDR family NAD(P)-dependent oxidoreductase [Streptomyces sp. NBC_00557]